MARNAYITPWAAQKLAEQQAAGLRDLGGMHQVFCITPTGNLLARSFPTNSEIRALGLSESEMVRYQDRLAGIERRFDAVMARRRR